MPVLVFDNGVLVVKIRHVTTNAGCPIYQRKVPADLRDHYGCVFMPRRSLAGLSVTEMAKRVASYARRDEAEWASVRAHPSTPAHIAAQVDAKLDKWRRLPRERYDDADEPSEADHLGETLDDYLLDTYGDAYFDLKRDDRYVGQRFQAALRSRLSAVDYETYRRVMAMKDPTPTQPVLSRVLEGYLTAKGDAFAKKSGPAVRLAMGFVFAAVGDRPLGAYRREHAIKVRDAIIETGVKTSSVRRRLNDIKAVFNDGRTEFDLGSLSNPFEKLKVPNEGDDATARGSFTIEELQRIANGCRMRDDDGAWIVALMLETGARLGEIVGLRTEDLFLTAQVPHIWIRPHKALGRTVKNTSSTRKVPLVGVSLWAAQAVPQVGPWLFPRYAADQDVKSGSASASLNPWLKKVSGADAKTCHCFRHTMIDRLKAAKVEAELRKAIVGHGTKTTHDKYGEGHPLDNLKEALVKVTILDSD